MDHTQCCRLRSCVQVTIARLVESDETRRQWGAHRLKLLLDLIPQKPEFPLGMYQKYNAFLVCMHKQSCHIAEILWN